MVLVMRLLSYYSSTRSLNIQDSNGDFALLYAAYNRNAILVKKLLEQGAEPDLVNKHNTYSLWYSVYNNDKATFFELIKYAKDFETKSYGIDYQSFETVPQIIYDTPVAPITVAEFNHYYDMVFYLYCLGANVPLELRKRIRVKYGDVTVENRDYRKLKVLNKLLNQPLSLARMCRKSIRKRVKFVDWKRGDVRGGLLPIFLEKFLSLEII
jgi:hypothetical protein